MMLHGLDAECGRDVRLAGSGPADQDDVVGAIDELAAVKLADEGLEPRRVCRRPVVVSYAAIGSVSRAA
jgi:hypothetical protein